MKKRILVLAAFAIASIAHAQNPLLDRLRAEMERNEQETMPMKRQKAIPAPARAEDQPMSGESVFNLKGLHLQMKRNEVQKVLPTSAYIFEKTVEGKELGSYACGPQIQRPAGLPATQCNFTFGGVPMQNIVVQFWGGTVVRVTMFFFNNDESKLPPGEALARLHSGLDEKYPDQASAPPRLGTRRPGDGTWESGQEKLAFDLSGRRFGILELNRPNLQESLNTVIAIEEQNKTRQQRQDRASQAAKDM